ncbi:hypothetical protein [Streptomyces sp. NPDC058466]|uniref:hypothetical protein n=1 Tax=Streptomyces sp. NPDC058466 TaxID=3346512 RepID=UPI00365C6750
MTTTHPRSASRTSGTAPIPPGSAPTGGSPRQALRERDLAKAASLTDAVAEALRQRDVPDGLAGLAAQTGWATFHQAAQAWIDDPSQSLDAHLLQAFDDLRALFATAPPAQARLES